MHTLSIIRIIAVAVLLLASANKNLHAAGASGACAELPHPSDLNPKDLAGLHQAVLATFDSHNWRGEKQICAPRAEGMRERVIGIIAKSEDPAAVRYLVHYLNLDHRSDGEWDNSVTTHRGFIPGSQRAAVMEAIERLSPDLDATGVGSVISYSSDRLIFKQNSRGQDRLILPATIANRLSEVSGEDDFYRGILQEMAANPDAERPKARRMLAVYAENMTREKAILVLQEGHPYFLADRTDGTASPFAVGLRDRAADTLLGSPDAEDYTENELVAAVQYLHLLMPPKGMPLQAKEEQYLARFVRQADSAALLAFLKHFPEHVNVHAGVVAALALDENRDKDFAVAREMLSTLGEGADVAELRSLWSERINSILQQVEMNEEQIEAAKDTLESIMRWRKENLGVADTQTNIAANRFVELLTSSPGANDARFLPLLQDWANIESPDLPEARNQGLFGISAIGTEEARKFLRDGITSEWGASEFNRDKLLDYVRALHASSGKDRRDDAKIASVLVDLVNNSFLASKGAVEITPILDLVAELCLGENFGGENVQVSSVCGLPMNPDSGLERLPSGVGIGGALSTNGVPYGLVIMALQRLNAVHGNEEIRERANTLRRRLMALSSEIAITQPGPGEIIADNSTSDLMAAIHFIACSADGGANMSLVPLLAEYDADLHKGGSQCPTGHGIVMAPAAAAAFFREQGLQGRFVLKGAPGTDPDMPGTGTLYLSAPGISRGE